MPETIFECNQDGHGFKTESLLKFNEHLAEDAHRSHNNSMCGRCEQERVEGRTNQKVPVNAKGPKVYCKACLKAILEESQVE